MTDVQDHPEYRSLVAAVRAAPADDLPRLVLADWLEEHDHDEWAEFVRVQCEVERHPHADRIRDDTFTDAEGVLRDWQGALTAARRVRELWPAVAAVIAHGCADEGQTGRSLWQLRRGRISGGDHLPLYEVGRGFVDRVRCPVGRWIGDARHDPLGPWLLARQPVRRVEFTDRRCDDERLSWIGFYNFDSLDRRLTHWLPWCLAHRLKGHARYHEAEDRVPVRHTWTYPTREAADDALSDAALAWASEQPDPAAQ